MAVGLRKLSGYRVFPKGSRHHCPGWYRLIPPNIDPLAVHVAVQKYEGHSREGPAGGEFLWPLP